MDAVPRITAVVARALHTAAVMRKDASQDGMVFGELWERMLTRSPGLREDRAQAVCDSPQEVDARSRTV